jgi:sugar phosphate isomerase/epimerase
MGEHFTRAASAPGGHLWVGAFYNPHVAREILAAAELFDHLAMADPPRADDPYFEPTRERFTLLLHDYLGQLSEPYDAHAIARSRQLAELYGSPWVAEHFQCLHTEDGRFNLDYVFPPLYTEEFLQRFIANASILQREVDRPLVMENIPGFFNVSASVIPEPEFLTRFFDATGCGFLLDLPHIWIEASLQGRDPSEFLLEFPLDRVVEIHTGGLVDDDDLQAPWIAPAAPSDEMLEFTRYAVGQCPGARAVTFDAFSPALTARTLIGAVERIRDRVLA